MSNPPCNRPHFLDRTTEIVYLTGARLKLSPRHMFPILKDPFLMAWWAFGTLVIVCIEPYKPIQNADFWIIALTGAICTAVIVAAYVAFSFLILCLAPLLGMRWFFSGSAAIPASALLMMLRHYISLPFTDQPASFGYNFLYFLFVVVVLEIQVSAFATLSLIGLLARHGHTVKPLPVVTPPETVADAEATADLTEPREPVAPVPPEFIILQGQPFPITEIVAVSAKGKHLVVRTVAGKKTVRAAFSAALAQLEKTRGYRIHRSHWVGEGRIRHKHRDAMRNLYVELLDGTILPVAQSNAQVIEGIPFAPARTGGKD